MRGHTDFEFLLRRHEQLRAADRDAAFCAPGSTRVLVAESSRLVAEALMVAIDVEPSLEPIGYALDGWEAIELAESLSPDVVVVGPQLAGLDGFTLTGLLNEFWPSVGVIRLTETRPTEERDRPFLSSAADCCVPLDRSADELIEAIAARSARASAPVGSYSRPHAQASRV